MIYKIIIITVLILLILFLIVNLNKKKNNFLNQKDTFKSKHKNLVFTSAGNNTNFDTLWTGGQRNFDIIVIYYKDDEKIYNKYKSKVDFILKRKGSKFQNFYFLYKNYYDKIKNYERFFILDDDIIFKTEDINKMFYLSEKYNLWICGPSFSSKSKISWPITRHQKGNLLRYTNFVEVNVPLYNKYALEKVMNYYDPILIGFGIDLLSIWAITKNKNELEYNKKIAIVDDIICTNPHDTYKNNKRELNNLKDAGKRAYYWEIVKKKHNIKIPKAKVFSTIKLS